MTAKIQTARFAARRFPHPRQHRNASAHGPAVFASWLSDIAKAKRFILLENYIFRSDRIGRQIADALCERARAGASKCYVLYDWLGSLAPAELCGFVFSAGRPRPIVCWHSLSDPLRLLQRNHRKVLCIDGQIGRRRACALGTPGPDIPSAGSPVAHTPRLFEGPAAAELCLAFDETWAGGSALPSRIRIPDDVLARSPSRRSPIRKKTRLAQ